MRIPCTHVHQMASHDWYTFWGYLHFGTGRFCIGLLHSCAARYAVYVTCQ